MEPVLRPLGRTTEEFRRDLLSNLYYERGTTLNSASSQDMFDALAITVRDRLAERRARTT
jgi:starch phosphorylase